MKEGITDREVQYPGEVLIFFFLLEMLQVVGGEIQCTGEGIHLIQTR